MRRIGERQSRESNMRTLEAARAALAPHLKDDDRRAFLRSLENLIKGKDTIEAEADISPEEIDRQNKRAKSLLRPI